MPSKKFITIVLAIFLLGAGIFWLFKNKGLGDNKLVFEKENNLVSGLFQPDKRDSDSDGLADWEESLWKTDINNSDTDKDGTLDGEEVKLGRNPLEPGPDDIYSPEKFSEATNTDIEEITETEKFSRNFFSQYLTLKMAARGEELDATIKEGLVNSLMENINTGIPITPYSLSGLKISPNNSKEAALDYGNKLSLIFQSHTNPVPGDEILFFMEMLGKSDESMITRLDKSVALYESLIKDSLGLSVPSDIKDQHLKLLNSLVLLKEISIRFRDYFKDPLAGLAAMNQHQNAATDYVDSLTEINNYLKNK